MTIISFGYLLKKQMVFNGVKQIDAVLSYSWGIGLMKNHYLQLYCLYKRTFWESGLSGYPTLAQTA
jgi:hypothetical protein